VTSSVTRDTADHNHYMKLIYAEDSCFLQYVVASLWSDSSHSKGEVTVIF